MSKKTISSEIKKEMEGISMDDLEAYENSSYNAAYPPKETVQPKKVAATLAMPSILSGGAVVLQASPEVMSAIAEVKDNLESIENFVLPKVKATADGLELTEGEKPMIELEGIIIHTKKQNIYYDKPFNKRDVQPPTCFSLDAVTPDESIQHPQNTTCKGCPKAEFGTGSTGQGKACRNMKPLYMLIGNGAILPRQLVVSPTSLKAANSYLTSITALGISYRKLKTKITAYKKESDDKYVCLKFSMGEKLTPEAARDVEFLRAQWLPVMDSQVINQSEIDPIDTQATSAVGSGTGMEL